MFAGLAATAQLVGLAAAALVCGCATTSLAPKPPRVIVTSPSGGFVEMPSGKKFIPWGFNYDHDRDKRLIEDYWDAEWAKVEEDFTEIRALNANVVRIHLQVGKFMLDAGQPNPAALSQLKRLAVLAEREGLKLDLTGLGSYRPSDVPAWYDALSESERWRTQARFWEAVASAVADSPAIFCYDLINEPVVPAEPKERWVYKGKFAFDFVQNITLDRKGRAPDKIVKKWIKTLVAAIRKRDKHHMITVGLLPDLRGGFQPSDVAPLLDFMSIHIYPRSDDMARARRNLQTVAVGKPVVIEEMFPLNCGIDDLERFILESRDIASGWIGFYWGETIEEMMAKRWPSGTLRWLQLFQRLAPVMLQHVPGAAAAPGTSPISWDTIAQFEKSAC